MLIVADGRRSTMIDYEVKQVDALADRQLAARRCCSTRTRTSPASPRWSATTPQVVLVQARDPKRPEFGTITIAFAKVASAPAGLLLQGWTAIDAQNNRTTVKLSNQRFNVRWRTAPSAGPTRAEPGRRKS